MIFLGNWCCLKDLVGLISDRSIIIDGQIQWQLTIRAKHFWEMVGQLANLC